MLQRLDDHIFFHFIQGHAANLRDGSFRSFLRTGLIFIGEIIQFDNIFVRNENNSFHQVFQFTDITWPGKSFQPFDSRIADP